MADQAHVARHSDSKQLFPFQVGEDAEIDVATVHKYFMESHGADVKLKDVFDEDSQYDIGEILSLGSDLYPKVVLGFRAASLV